MCSNVLEHNTVQVYVFMFGLSMTKYCLRLSIYPNEMDDLKIKLGVRWMGNYAKFTQYTHIATSITIRMYFVTASSAQAARPITIYVYKLYFVSN